MEANNHIGYIFDPEWEADILGPDYERLTVHHPDDYAGSPVVSTVVRYRGEPRTSRGVLYVHGFNDYFFQTEYAPLLARAGYAFYAVDLRRYGRSIRPTSRQFDVRSLREYFPDIDAALEAMRRDGVGCTALLGHSTGGLVASLYMSQQAPPTVAALALNSPFLEWNMGVAMRGIVMPLLSLVGRYFPNLRIDQHSGYAYGESLHREYHGEWTFDTRWKHLYLPPVTAGWIRAISKAQAYLKSHPESIECPVLLMHSDASVHGHRWSERFQSADGILNVSDISRLGRRLSSDVEEVTISGGLHDLALSAPQVRTQYFNALLSWLDRVMPADSLSEC